MKDNYSVEIADGTEYVRRPGHPRGYFIGVKYHVPERQVAYGYLD